MAFRLAAVIGFIALVPFGKLNTRIPGIGLWPLLVLLVITDSLGYLAYNLGISTAYVSIVSTLSSLYGLVSVVLGVIILKERLEVSQRYGIIAIAAGIVMLLT